MSLNCDVHAGRRGSGPVAQGGEVAAGDPLLFESGDGCAQPGEQGGVRGFTGEGERDGVGDGIVPDEERLPSALGVAG